MDFLDKSDQEQSLQDVDFEFGQATIGSGIDRAFDRRFKVAFDRRIERVERRECTNLLTSQGLCGDLECVEHRPLAFTQVRPYRAVLSNCGEDLLHQLELVGQEWILFRELLTVAERIKRHSDWFEADRLFQHFPVLIKKSLNLHLPFRGLAE